MDFLINEGKDKKQFPYVIQGIGDIGPQFFTEKSMEEIAKKSDRILNKSKYFH